MLRRYLILLGNLRLLLRRIRVRRWRLQMHCRWLLLLLDLRLILRLLCLRLLMRRSRLSLSRVGIRRPRRRGVGSTGALSILLRSWWLLRRSVGRINDARLQRLETGFRRTRGQRSSVGRLRVVSLLRRIRHIRLLLLLLLLWVRH